MKKNGIRFQLKASIASAIAKQALTAGGALAAIPSTSTYLYSTQPMLSGMVMWVNEHQLAVETEQGEDVILALDSRTMVPVDLAPGMVMRVQFDVREDGNKYAKRIIPIRDGMSESRELAYSRERARDASEAQYVSTSDGVGGENGASRASTALSATNQSLGTSLAATPATDAYLVAMQPMIAGQVVTVNDHRIVVDTDQGQRVALEMDSRTLIPSDLASDMTVRVEYKTMENGSKYARRITPIKRGPNTSSELSYVSEAVPQNAPAYTRAAAVEPESPKQTRSEEPESLPGTASKRPLIALLGFIALGAAGALVVWRGLTAAVIAIRD